MKTYKPLLLEVIDSIEAFIVAQGLPTIKFNIELNSVEAEYGKYQLQPEKFVELVLDIIND